MNYSADTKDTKDTKEKQQLNRGETKRTNNMIHHSLFTIHPSPVTGHWSPSY
jgi:hypothetical protein